MARKSTGCSDEQWSKEEIKEEEKNINDSFFLRVKEQKEIDKNRVCSKKNKKIADISKCLLRYMREYKPSNPAAKDYNP